MSQFEKPYHFPPSYRRKPVSNTGKRSQIKRRDLVTTYAEMTLKNGKYHSNWGIPTSSAATNT